MPPMSVRTFPATDPVEAFFATTSHRAGNKLACVKTAALHKMIRAATKMWSGVAQDDSELQPRRSSINLKPWWSQGAAQTTHAATSGVRAHDSRLVDNRWVLEGPAPAWFRGAEHLREGTPLALSDAFRVTQLLSAGDADDLEALLRVQVLPDPAARSAPAFVVSDPAAFRREVSDYAEVYWGPDGLLGVAGRDVGRNRHYQLVERPSPAHGPRFVANALSLCQRQASSSRPKRARPASLLPLSPQLKRARSLASVDNFHDIDAAHALAELVSA